MKEPCSYRELIGLTVNRIEALKKGCFCSILTNACGYSWRGGRSSSDWLYSEPAEQTFRHPMQSSCNYNREKQRNNWTSVRYNEHWYSCGTWRNHQGKWLLEKPFWERHQLERTDSPYYWKCHCTPAGSIIENKQFSVACTIGMPKEKAHCVPLRLWTKSWATL